jgi:hypothetical protein
VWHGHQRVHPAEGDGRVSVSEGRGAGGGLSLSRSECCRSFDLVADHIRRLRLVPSWRNSRIVIYVERNLGHEAEHHRHALKDIRGVFFREDSGMEQGVARGGWQVAA